METKPFGRKTGVAAQDLVLQLAKVLIGSAWNRAALFLIVGGIAAINGWLQYIAAKFIDIAVPETPPAIAFALIALGIVVLILGRIVPDRNAQTDVKVETAIDSFSALCTELKPLMDDNYRIFSNFGPNSGAGSPEPVRHNLNAWYEMRSSAIVPNNAQIRKLIQNSENLIPRENRLLFQQLLSHVDAFEAHVKNENVDYREHQFPQEITALVNFYAK